MAAKLIAIMRSKKTRNFLLFFVVLLFSVGLAKPAMAGFGSIIAGAILGVLSFFWGLMMNIAATITGAILSMAVIVFNWVVSPNFISLSYTNVGLKLGDPNFNAFVDIGWQLTRSFTNIIFVIAMVVIGLGTALRYKEYQMQKALPMLILIALLINFTPVILGLIIDASNVAMNFFISGGFEGGNNIANFATRQWSNIGSLIGAAKFWDPTSSNKAIAAAAGATALVSFNVIAALLYLLFALLFILRYVALWLLVILSPLAFACYVLPNTRGVWTQWWKIFIQWALFGIIMGFFLYLSDHFISIATSGKFLNEKALGESGRTPGLSNIVNNMLPYIVSIVLLFVGLVASLMGAPQGAQGILKGGERAIKTAGMLTARGQWGAAKRLGGAAKGAAIGIREGVKTYKIGRGAAYSPTGRRIKLPWSRKQSFKAAVGIGMGNIKLGAGLARPPEGYAKAVGKGFRKGVGEVWGAAFGKGKKKKPKKLKQCPNCHRFVDVDDAFCSSCGQLF